MPARTVGQPSASNETRAVDLDLQERAMAGDVEIYLSRIMAAESDTECTEWFTLELTRGGERAAIALRSGQSEAALGWNVRADEQPGSGELHVTLTR